MDTIADPRQLDIEDRTGRPRSFAANAGVFARVVAAATRVLDRGTIPILKHVLLNWSDDTATVVGTDMEIVTSIEFPVQGGSGECAVSGATLYDALKRLPPAGVVSIEQPSVDNDVTLSCGRFRATLRVMPASEFPAVAAPAFSHSFSMPAATLRRMIEAVRGCVSTEQTTRAYLCGVHLHVTDAHLIAVATNGGTLGKDEESLPEGARGMPGIIIPTYAANEISKLLSGVEGEASISVNDHRLQIQADGATIVTKLIDGDFPAYERIIPRGNPHTLFARKENLVRAVDAVAGFSEGVTGKGGAKGGLVYFDVSEEGCALSAREITKGDAADEIEGAVYSGDALRAGVMGRQLLTICAGLGERVEIAMKDDETPWVITDSDRPGLLYLVALFKI